MGPADAGGQSRGRGSLRGVGRRASGHVQRAATRAVDPAVIATGRRGAAAGHAPADASRAPARRDAHSRARPRARSASSITTRFATRGAECPPDRQLASGRGATPPG